jgi:hypothetical protein
MLSGTLTDDLTDVSARETVPFGVPAVVTGGGVPSVAADGSPSRDRLARIAAMVGHAGCPAIRTTGGVRRQRR